MIYVARGIPTDEGATRLLRESHALMEALFPPEANNYLDIEALLADHIQFFIATDGKATLGTAALSDQGDYAEVKSMFVAKEARGHGVGRMLLDRLEHEARLLGHSALKLETGDRLHAARLLYARAGFKDCAAFGDYRPEPSSVYMEKVLL